MDCPVCQCATIVFEYKAIELDYCPVCMGVWFDAGEVELLMQTAGIDVREVPVKFQPPDFAVTEAARRCPLCDKKMEKVTFPGSNIVLDRCPNGDGVWFDSGEFSASVKHLLANAGETDDALKIIADFLGEALDNE